MDRIHERLREMQATEGQIDRINQWQVASMRTFFNDARKEEDSKKKEEMAVQPDAIKRAFEPLKSSLEGVVGVVHDDPKKGAGQQLKEVVEGTQPEPTSKHGLG